VTGRSFTPTAAIHWNGQSLGTTVVSGTTLTALAPPLGTLQAAMINVVDSAVPNRTSNTVPVIGGTATNQGTLTTIPAVPVPGTPLAIRVEGGLPYSPITLVMDIGSPGIGIVLGNQVLGVGSTLLFPLVDSLGVFGGSLLPTGPCARLDARGELIIHTPPLPTPQAGVSAVLQAVYLTPVGPRLTWALFPVPL
jgi:hypothetical protein